MKRVEVFDVLGEITRANSQNVNKLAKRKQDEINRRLASTGDNLADIAELVLQEPGIAIPGLIQVTLVFEVAQKKGGDR